MNRIDPNAPAPQFEPLEWLSGRASEIRALVDGVIANEAFRPVLPAERLEDRADKVVEAFEAMKRAREEQEDQRVTDTPPDAEAVEEFKRKVREPWEAHRLAGPALTAAGMYEVAGGEPEEGTKWGLPRQWGISPMMSLEQAPLRCKT